MVVVGGHFIVQYNLVARNFEGFISYCISLSAQQLENGLEDKRPPESTTVNGIILDSKDSINKNYCFESKSGDHDICRIALDILMQVVTKENDAKAFTN